MGLLQDIITEAVAPQGEVPRLLRLCLLLGSRLKNEPLKKWALQELEGYRQEIEVPEYRKLKTQNKGHFMGSFTGVFEIPVGVLPEALQDHYVTVQFRDSIAEAADLAARTAKSGELRIPWPIELTMQYASTHVRGSQCTSAWMSISASNVVAIVDIIKTKVLAFALEIEAADPSAGDVIGATTPTTIKEEKVTQIFNTTINGGNVQNMALGNSKVTQTVLGSIRVGDLQSLLDAMKTLGVSSGDVQALELALNEDKTTGSHGMGTKVKTWLADFAIACGTKASEAGATALVALVTQCLTNYFPA